MYTNLHIKHAAQLKITQHWSPGMHSVLADMGAHALAESPCHYKQALKRGTLSERLFCFRCILAPYHGCHGA